MRLARLRPRPSPPREAAPSPTANTTMRTSPNQNTGTDTPARATRLMRRSYQEKGFMAARVPAGSAMERARRKLVPRRTRVFARAGPSTSRTGAAYSREYPRSPRAACTIHVHQRSRTGRSRPWRALRRRASSGVRSGSEDTMRSMGSPGISPMRAYTTTDITPRTSAACHSRPRTSAVMPAVRLGGAPARA